jgi:hypothetical protein
MTRTPLRQLFPFAAAALIGLSLPATAAVQRTFVASTGSDAFPCSLTQPCRGFAAALVQTNPGGEIIVLDSAGYGPVTINKAVSIIAPAGIYAGITAGSGNGIVVNAPGGHVILRGLEINGLGTSTGSGILHQAGASLEIDRCTVSGFANDVNVIDGPSGIRLLAGPVTIANTVVKNNLKGGITVLGANAQNMIRVTVVNSRVEGNGSGFGDAQDAGVAALAGALVTVKDTVATGNFRGYSVCGNGQGQAVGAAMSIENSLTTRNVVGLLAASNQVACAVRVSNTTITDNSLFGIEQQSGSVATSLGNNFVYDNAGGETFGLTTTPK